MRRPSGNDVGVEDRTLTVDHDPMKRTDQAIVGWMLMSLLNCLPKANASVQLVSVDLKSAARFAVLSGAGITSTGGGLFYGDIGTSPITGAAITGITTTQMHGVIYIVDLTGPAGSVVAPRLLNEAKMDLTAAFDDAAGRTPAETIADGVLAGTWLPGLYKDNGAPASLGLTGTMILDAQGDSDAVWIFQSASTLVAEVDSRVILTNGAQAGRVFWLVGSSATLKTSSQFSGTILALTAITMDTASTLTGRALAQNAAITVNGQFVQLPSADVLEFTDIQREAGEVTIVTLETTPYFELTLQSSSTLLRPNWQTLAIDTPVASVWSYTDVTETANITHRFYRAIIQE
jgi:hypothetical protein